MRGTRREWHRRQCPPVDRVCRADQTSSLPPTSRRRRVMRFRSIAPLLVVGLASVAGAQGAIAKRPLRLGDMYRVKNVNDPQISPDGRWVAYTVSTTDSAKDKSDTDVWMTSWDGSQTIQVTSSPDGESNPRWSPDGRYLSFISSRQAGKGGQLWLLDRRGGEAKRVTELR